MTSYEFEVAAKNALLKVMESEFNIMLSIKDLHFVWFGYVLGNMKCMIYSPEMGRMYAEVTWLKDHQMMAVDVYEKRVHHTLAVNMLDFEAHV